MQIRLLVSFKASFAIITRVQMLHSIRSAPWSFLSVIGRIYTRGALSVWTNLDTFVVRLVMRLQYKDGHKTNYYASRRTILGYASWTTHCERLFDWTHNSSMCVSKDGHQTKNVKKYTAIWKSQRLYQPSKTVETFQYAIFNFAPWYHRVQKKQIRPPPHPWCNVVSA